MMQISNVLLLNLLLIILPTNTEASKGNTDKPNRVDKEHYNKMYGSRLQRKDIDYLKPGGSPWPWYEQAKIQHGDDKLLHKEQKREHKDYQAEYKKQFSENMRVYQETQRVNLETEREGAILNATNTNDAAKSNQKRRRKEEIVLSKKESKRFLK
ncbi:uncharacterized protein [Clytia hemisphaerica]